MTKSISTYWNTLSLENRDRWTPIKGLEGMDEELTLSIDQITGEYTRLPGADTSIFGSKSHLYPEEVFIISGRLTIRRLIFGWKPGITPAAHPVNFMVRSKRMLGALSWRCRFPVRLWVIKAMPKQYITDTTGQKISVILPMEEYMELMEDVKDLAVVAELRDEPTIPWEQVKRELMDNDLL